MNDTQPIASLPLRGDWGKRLKRLFVKTILGLLLLVGVGGAGWFWLSLNYVYSTGNRAGYLQKFSKKGWLIKTWEGELSMINIPGAAPEKFFFTVRSPTLADRMSDSIGQRVGVTYNEHKILPGRLFGDTPYFVTDVKMLSDDLPDPSANR